MTEHVANFYQDGILTIQLARPEKKNALTAAMYAEVAKQLKRANDDEEIRVIIIHGADDFTAGNDIADFLHQTIDQTSPVLQFLHALADCRKPLIAAVKGVAVGVGTTMLLHCDFVYAHPESMFSLPFVKLGLCAEAASSLLLPRTVGRIRATEWLLLGEPFGAQTAFENGLLTRICEDPLAVARATAEQLVRMSPEAIQATRALIRTCSQENVHDVIDKEAETFARLLKTEAARSAFEAFLAKK